MPTMADARFQFFTRVRGAVEWRLISANNWELGRCPRTYETLDAAVAAVLELRENVDGCREELWMSAADVSGWRWRLRRDTEEWARSGRSYLRRVECESTMRQFRKLAATAAVVPKLHTFR